MVRINSKLRSVTGKDNGTVISRGFMHYCPGCESAHIIWTENQPGRPTWTFNGNHDAPSFEPSIRSFIPARPATKDRPAKGERTLCHYFLRDGVIEFLGDSSIHELRGKHPLPDIPDDYGGGED